MQLRTYRESQRLSINQAAGELGVRHETLRRWETGERRPDLDMVAVIAEWSRGHVTAADFADPDMVRCLRSRMPSAGRQDDAA